MMCSDESLCFDADGVHRLHLAIGHHVLPEGKKRWRWKCFVQCEVADVVESVIFEVQDGLSTAGVCVRSPPYEYERSTACVYTSLTSTHACACMRSRLSLSLLADG